MFCRLVTMKPNTGSGLQARSGGRHDGGGGWEGEGNVLGEREHPAQGPAFGTLKFQVCCRRTPLARLRVDHLVYGVTGSLAAAMASFQLRTGVAPVRGGRHEGLGTHNALVSLGDGAYFEIICRDAEQPSPPRLWMGMESLSDERSAVMLTWATDRAGEMAEAVCAARAQGYDPGDVEAFERSKPDGSTLRWRLAYRHFTRLQQGAGSGIVPFLIEWKSESPAATAPGGIELVGLRAEAKDLAAVERSLRSLGIAPADLQLQRGEEDRLFVILRTPKGVVEL